MTSTVRWKVRHTTEVNSVVARGGCTCVKDVDTVLCRDCTSHDVCNKPGNGHVLGNLALECHGNHGTVAAHLASSAELTVSASGLRFDG